MLLLDEVMAGLNPTETDEAVELIRKINENGTTILLIEHVMRQWPISARKWLLCIMVRK